jgi:aldehyde dehydrogenase (NAD+)
LKQHETFAPFIFIEILRNCRECHCYSKRVAQGLSSAIMTNNLREAELFLVVGSDCGIANVNIGTSGAEIGGAFGGKRNRWRT